MMRLESALSGDELEFLSFDLSCLSRYLLIWLICLYNSVGKSTVMAPFCLIHMLSFMLYRVIVSHCLHLFLSQVVYGNV